MAIDLIAKIAPKNDAFTGMVDAKEVLGDGSTNTLPANTIADATITFAKMQHIGAAGSNALFLGRNEDDAGDIETLSKADALSILNVADGAQVGTVTSVATTGTVNGLTLTGGPITGSGTITLGGTLTINNGDWSGTALADGNIASASTWNALNTNVTTNLSISRDGTKLHIICSDGTNAELPLADTDNWGVMSDELYDNVIANNAKVTFPGFGTSGGTALEGDTTIPSGNAIIDWTADSAGTIHASNYVDNNTQLDNAGVTGKVLTGLNGASGGTLAGTDTILAAFGKLEYRVALNDVKVTNTDVDVSIGNLDTRLGELTEDFTIGDATDVNVTFNGAISVWQGIKFTGGGSSISMTGSTGTNTDGDGLFIASGASTGTGDGGVITFKVSEKSVSGTGVNIPTEQFAIGVESGTISGQIAINSRSKFFLDGTDFTGDTYIQEGNANVIQFVAEDTQQLEVSSGKITLKESPIIGTGSTLTSRGDIYVLSTAPNELYFRNDTQEIIRLDWNHEKYWPTSTNYISSRMGADSRWYCGTIDMGAAYTYITFTKTTQRYAINNMHDARFELYGAKVVGYFNSSETYEMQLVATTLDTTNNTDVASVADICNFDMGACTANKIVHLTLTDIGETIYENTQLFILNKYTGGGSGSKYFYGTITLYVRPEAIL